MFNPYGLGCSPFYTFAIQNFPFIEKDFDALTDYQLMCKIFKYLDDEIKKVDNKYSGIYSTVERLEQDFVDFTTNIERQQAEFETEINSKIITFQEQVLASVDVKNEQLYNRVVQLMGDYKIVFETYVNTQIAQVNQRIDDIEVGEITIYNPLTGTVDPLGTVIDDLYNALRYDAITCSEYDNLELTATTYDGYLISAQNFDLYGKSILMGN